MSLARCALLVGLMTASLVAQGPPPPPGPPIVLPATPAPVENPITESKRVLGKILFWDEQMSSTDMVACGTCHRPAQGGTDPRIAINPGLNGVIDPPGAPSDDVRGSPGVPRADASNNYQPDAVFGFNAQVTHRRAPSATSAAFNPVLFWDGRASSTFVNPDTALVSIATGGALESQALGPILGDAEMAHAGRTFIEATTKLVAAKPMKLAANVPADMVAAIAAHPSYPLLFAAAFGDTAITAQRIAFAIATYERTLFPNQTPYDAFAAGNPAALTPNQAQGRAIFNSTGQCSQCHAEPTFSDGQFHNLGLRPIAEDNGRQGITNNGADRGKFKTPSLRNASLRPGFFHNGGIPTVAGVVGFYAGGGGPNLDNKDPILANINLPPQDGARVTDYLNALTDPRAAAGQFPFDRPTLRSEILPANANRYAQATPGTGGFAPQMLVTSPAYLGNPDFRLGVFNALGGSQAVLGVSTAPLVPSLNSGGLLFHVDPNQAFIVSTLLLSGSGPGGGYATFHTTIPADPAIAGFIFFAEWFVVDGNATGGASESQGAAFTLF